MATVDAKSQVIFLVFFRSFHLPPLISCYCKQMAVQFPANQSWHCASTMHMKYSFRIIWSDGRWLEMCQFCWTRRIHRSRNLPNGYGKIYRISNSIRVVNHLYHGVWMCDSASERCISAISCKLSNSGERECADDFSFTQWAEQKQMILFIIFVCIEP